ncbi:MAG: hypothetical protein DME04_10960 [Candidatus Rokuibacteriota bacterium]|nr:MAG: hypothetical protein DME04_10960 [Candidatus Rokubacteria bacterium]
MAPEDLERIFEFRNQQGKLLKFPLWPQLQHVVNHATHHRSEIATNLLQKSGQ